MLITSLDVNPLEPPATKTLNPLEPPTGGRKAPIMCNCPELPRNHRELCEPCKAAFVADQARDAAPRAVSAAQLRRLQSQDAPPEVIERIFSQVITHGVRG